uniref:Uncharacterized protein n=1 Tax=Amphimedon queenslandica TaxID=400682 RepID=A0A1X7UJD2_AMPQE
MHQSLYQCYIIQGGHSHSPSKYGSVQGDVVVSSYYNGKPQNVNKLIPHFYLVLALILSVLFSFTGVLAFALVFTIPAAIYARKVPHVLCLNNDAYSSQQAIRTRDDQLRRSRLKCSIYCSITGCVVGSLSGLVVFSGIIGLLCTITILLFRFSICNQIVSKNSHVDSQFFHFTVNFKSLICNATTEGN